MAGATMFGDAVLAPATGSRRTAFGDDIIGGTVPSPQHTQSIGDAIIAGLQSSATGLALRGKLPEQQLDPEAPWYHRAASGFANMGADLPLSVVGAVGGAVAGSTVMPGPGTLVGGGAGAFAAPMALRDALIEAYSHNYASSWEGVWEIAKAAMKGGGKGAVIGGLTGGAGVVAGRTIGAAVAPGVGTTMTAKGAIRTIEAGALGAELGVLTTASAALEGHMPTGQDFLDNAILLGGMKAAVGTAQALRNIYAETGRRPEQVVADAMKDAKLKDELVGGSTAEKSMKELGAYEMSLEKVAKEGDNAQSPWLMPDGKILGTGQDHLAVIADTAEGYSGFMRSTGAVRAAFFKDAENGYVVSLHMAEGQQLTRQQIAALERIEALRGEPIKILEGRANGLVNPEYVETTVAALPRASVPAAYGPLALEQRINAAIDADARPEMIRKNLSGDPVASGIDPVKYEYVTDRDTAVGVLRNVTQLYENEIKAQTRGVVPNKQTAAEALKTIASGEVVEHVVGTADNAASIYARAHMLRGATNEAVVQLKKIADVAEADLTPSMKLGAVAAIERVAMLHSEFAGAAAEAGRALQIFRAMKRDPSFLGEAESIIKLAERKGSLQDIARMVETLKDPAQVAEFMRQHAQATTMEKVIEGWKASILSGPQTHLANILGNLTKYVIDVPESIISASLAAVNKAAKGDPMTLAQWKARAFAPFIGIQLGAKDGLLVAAEIWKGRGQHLEKADVYRTAIEGKKGEVIRTPFKLLQMQDALFRTMAERAKAYEMAVDRVAKEALHPDTIEAKERVALYAQRPEFGLSDKMAAGVLAEIQNAGAEAVFSQRLGPKMEMLQRATQGSLLAFVIPFVRTPANLVSWAIQHVPGLNLLSGRWRNDFMAGGEARAKATARVVVGAGIAITAYQLAQEGLITGGGLFDKEEGGTKRGANWQPYSLLIDGKYYSYQRIEPVAKVIGLAADLIELQQATKDPEDKAKVAMMLALLFGNATVSTTYLSGVSNAIQAVTDPSRFGENFLEQYATSVVPKIVGQTTAIADPYKREVHGVVDAIQSQLPFLREKLMPKRDVWGVPAANDRWFSVMPIATSQASHDKVKTEAMRLELAIADVPKFMMEKGPFNPKDKRLELTDQQRDVWRQVSGSRALEILSPVVNSPDWAGIPDFAKAAIYKGVIEATRREGAQAALPADAAAREALRTKIVDRIVREQQAVENK